MKWMLLSCGFAMGLTSLSVAMGSVPSRVTNDTAIYQSLSEIRVPKQEKINFDGDIEHLNRMEAKYREDLPDLKIQGPMKRISHQKYRFSGATQASRQ